MKLLVCKKIASTKFSIRLSSAFILKLILLVLCYTMYVTYICKTIYSNFFPQPKCAMQRNIKRSRSYHGKWRICMCVCSQMYMIIIPWSNVFYWYSSILCGCCCAFLCQTHHCQCRCRQSARLNLFNSVLELESKISYTKKWNECTGRTGVQ